jgi:predicted dinucleotide-utilizing enzyme
LKSCATFVKELKKYIVLPSGEIIGLDALPIFRKSSIPSFLSVFLKKLSLLSDDEAKMTESRSRIKASMKTNTRICMLFEGFISTFLLNL